MVDPYGKRRSIMVNIPYMDPMGYGVPNFVGVFFDGRFLVFSSRQQNKHQTNSLSSDV